MNNLCMLWSLLEDMYINIGYRNGLPPETAASALQCVGEKKHSQQHWQLICILLLPSTPLLITLLPLLSPFNAEGYQCQGRRSAPQMCTDTVCMGSTYK